MSRSTFFRRESTSSKVRRLVKSIVTGKRVKLEPIVVQCVVCRGTGRDHTGEWPCIICSGEGKLR